MRWDSRLGMTEPPEIDLLDQLLTHDMRYLVLEPMFGDRNRALQVVQIMARDGLIRVYDGDSDIPDWRMAVWLRMTSDPQLAAELGTVMLSLTDAGLAAFRRDPPPGP